MKEKFFKGWGRQISRLSVIELSSLKEKIFFLPLTHRNPCRGEYLSLIQLI